MPTSPNDPKGFSLRRWSQRKRESARPPAEDRSAPAAMPPAAPAGDSAIVAQQASEASTAVEAAQSGTAVEAPAVSPVDLPRTIPQSRPAGLASALPPVESLTADSDFAAFMRPEVDDTLKRGALKKLFSDPHFNVMDGLDTYIDDYSKPDPLDPQVARALVQALRVFDGPRPATASPSATASPPATASPTAARASPAVSDVAEGPVAGSDAPGNVAEAQPKAVPAGAPNEPAGAPNDPPGTPQ